MSPSYPEKVSLLTAAQTLRSHNYESLMPKRPQQKKGTLVVSFCQKNSELSVISEKSTFFHRLISIFPIACECRSSCTMHELNTSRMLKILVMFALSGRNLIIVESLLA